MANELTLNSSLCVTDATSPTRALQSGDVLASITTDQQLQLKLSVPTTGVLLPLSALVLPGYATFVNRDPTNVIDLYTGNPLAGGKRFAQLPPGIPCGPLLLGVDATAPYAVARVAACVMEMLVCDT